MSGHSKLVEIDILFRPTKQKFRDNYEVSVEIV